MPLCSNVAQAEHSVGAELALDREHVSFRVRHSVFVIEAGSTGDGYKLRPVDAVVGVRWSCAQRRKGNGKTLTLGISTAAINKRSRKQRGLGTAVEITERCITHFIKTCGVLKSCVEHPESCPNATVARRPEESASEAALWIWRIRQPKARAKILVSNGTKCSRNPRVTWEDPAFGRTRKNDRLHSRHDRLNLIVFFVPRCGYFPSEAVVQNQILPDPPAILPINAEVATGGVHGN